MSMEIPEATGEIQKAVEGALEHIEHVWAAMRRTGALPSNTTDPREDPRIKEYKIGTALYHLQAMYRYLQRAQAGMEKLWGTTEGQLCPYQDCCHDLALPIEGWYTCGHCKRLFWCRETDSDIEDYHCYRDGEHTKYEPAKPENIPEARDMGPSWATPKEAKP